MFHFRTRAEIEDLPIWIHGIQPPRDVDNITTFVPKKMGDMAGLVGALDIGSCMNIQRIKLDLWIHDWTNTGTFGGTSGPPTGVTHNARVRVQRTYEIGEFAFLSPVFDWDSIVYPSFGDIVPKVYANEAERLEDITLTPQQEGFAFKQASDNTYWVLKRAGPPPEWERFGHPLLPSTKAAFVSAMAGGSLGESGFTTALFVGTSYAGGKFQNSVDPDFVTHLDQNELPTAPVGPGIPYYDYDPPLVGSPPANVIEQIGRTFVQHGHSSDDRFLNRFLSAGVRYKYGDSTDATIAYFGQVLFWPNYDEPLVRSFAGIGHEDSWFIRAHSFPSDPFQFPELGQDNGGVPYPYTPDTVNAGHEAISEQDIGYLVFVSDGVGQHLDYKTIIKFDMGELAQSWPVTYPLDPAKYIRDLQPMK